MSRNVLLVPALLCAIGLTWGCQKPSDQAASNKPLEARVAKLEKEVEALTAAKLRLEDSLSTARKQAQDHAMRAGVAEKRLNSTLAELAEITAERDELLAQYDSFRKTIRELLTDADATAARPMPSEALSVDNGVGSGAQ